MSFSTPDIVCIQRTINVNESSKDTTCQDFCDRFDINKSVDWIKTNKFEKVCLQLPDHLLGESVKLCKKLKDLIKKDVFILADTTYNSCCVDEVAARHIGGDAIIHYGHSCLSSTTFPVLLVHDKAVIDSESAVDALHTLTPSQNIVLFYDVSLEYLRETICRRFFEVFPSLRIGVISDEITSTVKFCRQIIDKDGVRQDSKILSESHLVYLGEEGPTLFNLAVASRAKELHLLDARTSTLSVYTQSQWFKRRRYLIEKCKDANNIGILVCTLSKINYISIIKRLKKIVRDSGKKCYTLTVGKPNVAKLANLSEIEIFVLVACPENDLYSSKDFMSPIIYPYELELALNHQRDPYEANYSTDFNELLPEGGNYCSLAANGNQQLPDVSLISGNMRNVNLENKLGNINGAERQLNSVRKEDWAVQEMGIGKAISEKTWKGLEQDLEKSKPELATVGRKGIASGYDVELF